MHSSVLTPAFLAFIATTLGPGFVKPFATSAFWAILVVQTAIVVAFGLYVTLTMTPAILDIFERLWTPFVSRMGSLIVSLMFACPLRYSPPAMIVLRFCASAFGYSSEESWDPELCVSPTSVGSIDGGTRFTILGRPGSSVRTMRLYRNIGRFGYLRGIVVVFSDGTEMQAGVRKDQFSELTLSNDELITGMTLWAYYPSARSFFSFWRKADDAHTARVGRINVTTTQRSWGYGIGRTAALSSKSVNVGSGLLVGFQGRAGDGIDQIAPIFLKPLSNSVVEDIVFEQTPDPEGLRLMTLREGSALWDGTNYTWSFSGTDTRDTSTTFSIASSNSFSASSTFTASLPRILNSGLGASWDQGTTETYEQHSGRSTQLTWSTTISMSADNPAVSCFAVVWEGRVHLRWSGIQKVMADGVTASFPTSGLLTHTTYGKVETVCSPMDAQPPGSSDLPTWLSLT